MTFVQGCMYAAVGFVTAGAALAVVSIWVPETWANGFAPKGLLTFGVLALTSITVATIVKGMG